MSDSRRTGNQPGRVQEILNLLFVALIGWLSLTQQLAEHPASAASVLGEREFQSCQMDQDGYLRGEIFGTIQRNLVWQGDGMLCDGMPRPGNSGLRLMFSEYSEQPERGLRLVIGIVDATLGETGEELTTNVTVIDQDSGLFFSAQGLERCWVTIDEQVPLSAPNHSWRIDGQLYCLGALASVDGPDSVTLGDIEFSGRLTADLEGG